MMRTTSDKCDIGLMSLSQGCGEFRLVLHVWLLLSSNDNNFVHVDYIT